MSKTEVAVLDFGSSKITILVGSKTVNDTLIVKAKGECDYAGFMDGEFLEPDKLALNIKSALIDVEEVLCKKIKKLYIGAPTEFCLVENKYINLYFSSPKKIKSSHLAKLFASPVELQSTEYFVANKTAVYYILDNNQKTLYPEGCYSAKISALASYALVHKSFVELINKNLKQIGVNDVEYVVSALGQALYLFNSQQKEESGILVDCGYITTTVALVSGEGITDLKSFSMGGGFITSDLSEVLGLSFDSSEILKRKLIITVFPSEDDTYNTIENFKNIEVSMKKVNDIALARIDLIAECIEKCISVFDRSVPQHIPIYLTGGGLSYIKGIKDYLSKLFQRKIEILTPKPLQLSKPELSSVISLLDTAIKMEE